MEPAEPDRGSVSPLVLGMALCLLLLGAGVLAAGSAQLARQTLQHQCDGAAAAAAAGALGAEPSAGVSPSPLDRARAHLAIRAPDVAVGVELGTDVVLLRCARSAPVTFGALFGRAQVEVAVTAVGRPSFRVD